MVGVFTEGKHNSGVVVILKRCGCATNEKAALMASRSSGFFEKKSTE
jgi:hypothetical protein